MFTTQQSRLVLCAAFGAAAACSDVVESTTMVEEELTALIPSNGSVPDARAAFDAIKTTAEWGYIYRTANSPPNLLGDYNSSSEHFQGIQRARSGGYFFVTGDSTGDIFSIQLPTVGTGSSGYVGHTIDSGNTFVAGWTIARGNPHVGGFQIEGDYLVLRHRRVDGFTRRL